MGPPGGGGAWGRAPQCDRSVLGGGLGARTPPTLRLLCHSPARHPESWRGGASARSGLYKPLSTFTPPTTQALVFRGASGPSPVPPPPRSGRPGQQHKSPTAALGGECGHTLLLTEEESEAQGGTRTQCRANTKPTALPRLPASSGMSPRAVWGLSCSILLPL